MSAHINICTILGDGMLWAPTHSNINLEYCHFLKVNTTIRKLLQNTYFRHFFFKDVKLCSALDVTGRFICTQAAISTLEEEFGSQVRKPLKVIPYCNDRESSVFKIFLHQSRIHPSLFFYDFAIIIKKGPFSYFLIYPCHSEQMEYVFMVDCCHKLT